MMVEAEAVKSPIPPSGELTQRLNCCCAARVRRAPPRRALPGDRAEHAESDQAAAEATSTAVDPKAPSQSRSGRRERRRKWRQPPALRAEASVQRGGPRRGRAAVYQITLMPGPDVLRRGVNPLGVLDELRELGETTITTDPDLVPPLEQLDPERCYLSWTIQVKTAASPERISRRSCSLRRTVRSSISRLAPDGKLVPVRPATAPPGEAAAAPPIGFEKPAPRCQPNRAAARFANESRPEAALLDSSRRRAR